MLDMTEAGVTFGELVSSCQDKESSVQIIY